MLRWWPPPPLLIRAFALPHPPISLAGCCPPNEKGGQLCRPLQTCLLPLAGVNIALPLTVVNVAQVSRLGSFSWTIPPVSFRVRCGGRDIFMWFACLATISRDSSALQAARTVECP